MCTKQAKGSGKQGVKRSETKNWFKTRRFISADVDHGAVSEHHSFGR